MEISDSDTASKLFALTDLIQDVHNKIEDSVKKSNLRSINAEWIVICKSEDIAEFLEKHLFHVESK